MAHKEIADLNGKRGLVAAELSEIGAELSGHRGPAFDFGALALDAILGDETAAAELGRREARKDYLKRRAEMCRQAIAHADERIEVLRVTWLQGPQLAAMPLEEIPEVVAFVGEAAFRAELAFDVLRGRVPMVKPRRWWNRNTEPPTFVDVHGWTADRLLFSVLFWPPLEEPIKRRERDHHERVHQVIRVLHEGATELAWSTRYEIDDLTWDAGREVWVGSDNFSYDGEMLFEYSRGGNA